MAYNASSVFNILKPHLTYTIEQFIQCQSDEIVCYNNLSFIDQYDGIKFNTYNVLSDYIDEIREEYCKTVVLDKDQMIKYMYRPKLLCYDIYGNGELAFIILIINDMCSVKDFNKNTLLMPTKDNMAEITKYIYNASKEAIDIYNEKNKN